MANGVLEKRKKNNVATKPAQLNNLGILTPDKDKEGNKVTLQPTIVSRPNALETKAFMGGRLGTPNLPSAGLADMAVHANQAGSNQTNSGVSAASQYTDLMAQKKKKKKAQENQYGALGSV